MHGETLKFIKILIIWKFRS